MLPDDFDWADKILVLRVWVLWLLCFGFITWSATWKDPKTKTEKEYIIPGLI